jgi:hypothetical protein
VIGDAFQVAFPTAPAVLGTALDAQRASAHPAATGVPRSVNSRLTPRNTGTYTRTTSRGRNPPSRCLLARGRAAPAPILRHICRLAAGAADGLGRGFRSPQRVSELECRVPPHRGVMQHALNLHPR